MLTNVQSGAVALQEPIDNRNGNLRVSLRSITYMVGWYNVGAGESISWRAPSNNESRRPRPRSTTVAPGLYGIEDLIKLLEEAANDRSARIAISTNRLNGLLTLTVTNGWEVQITNGLLTLLGLEDGRGGRWLVSGAYDGDRPVNFTTTKSLHVHLNQLNTTKNFVDSAQSTLLTSVGIGRHAFGDIHTVSIPNPEFKRLCGGTLVELKVEIREDSGELLNNHSLPIAVTLEIQQVWVSMWSRTPRSRTSHWTRQPCTESTAWCSGRPEGLKGRRYYDGGATYGGKYDTRPTTSLPTIWLSRWRGHQLVPGRETVAGGIGDMGGFTKSYRAQPQAPYYRLGRREWSSRWRLWMVLW